MDNPFNDGGLISDIVMAFRIFLIPMVLYNMSHTCKAFRQVVSGRANPMSLYRSILFFTLVPQLGLSVTAIIHAEEVGSGPLSLIWLMFFAMFNIAVIAGRYTHQVADFDKFFWLFEQDNLDVAIRAVKLNHVDPEGYEECTGNSEVKIVERILKDVGISPDSARP